MAALSLVDAATLAPTDVDATRAIYEGAFPDELTAPFESLLADRMLVLLEDGAPAGMAVLRDLADTGWAFLRYYVVGRRGGGLGSAFWGLLRDAHAGYSRIVLDVEDPDRPGIDAAERELDLRRIAFYERLGVVLLPVHTYEPLHDGVPQPLRPMLTDLPGPTPAVPDDLRELVLAIYLHRYGMAADHPDVVACLAASGL